MKRLRAGAELLGATGVSQLALLAATVLCVRWIGPEGFAAYGVVFAAAWIINAVNSLAVESRLAVVGDELLLPLLRVGVAGPVVFACAGVLVLGAASTLFGGFLEPLGYALAASVPMAWHVLLQAVAVREERYRDLARLRVTQALVNAGAMLVLAATLRDWRGLAMALIVSFAASVFASRRVFPHASRPPTRADIRCALRVVGPQPLTGLLSNAAQYGTFLLLPVVAGPSLAGAWALLGRVVGGASTGLVSVLQPLFIGQFSAAVRANNRSMAVRAFHAWAGLGFVAGGAVAAATLALARWSSLSDSWYEVAALAPIAALFYGMQVAALPTHQTYVLTGHLRRHLVLMTTRNTVVLAVLCGVASLTAPLHALSAWAAVAAAGYASILLAHWVFLRRSASFRVVPVT